MNENDLSQLVEVRKYIIECHDSLDGLNVNTAVNKQAEVAHEYSAIIKMIENVLRPYVNFD